MSGLGWGIGSFVDGLNNGLRMRQAMDANDLMQRRMDLAEEENQRAQAEENRKATTYGQTQAEYQANAAVREAERQNALELAKYNKDNWAHQRSDWAHLEEDRAANQPLVDAERKLKLGTTNAQIADNEQAAQTRDIIQNAGSEAVQAHQDRMGKSILAGKDAAGNDTFTVDGKTVGSRPEAERIYEQNHGDVYDNYRENAAPKIYNRYMQLGHLQDADVFRKWVESNTGRETIELSGKLMQAVQLGDWNGVNDNFKKLLSPKYFGAKLDYDIKDSTPIVEDGKPVGISATLINKKDGSEYKREVRDMRELAPAIDYFTNPALIFETELSNYKAEVEARNKGAGKNLEEVAKANAQRGTDLQKEIAIALKDQLKLLEESADPVVRNMTPQQKAERARQAVMAVFGLAPQTTTAKPTVAPNTLMPRPPLY